MLDYHVHSTCSGDGKASVEQMCARAVELGICEIAFTEHVDNNPEDICYDKFDLDSFCRQTDLAQAKFGEALRIVKGAEFGEPHLYRRQLEELCDSGGLDFIMGAVHWVGDTIVAVDAFADSDVERLYYSYFDEVLKAVECGGFDVLAHFDLVKRFGVKYAGPFRLEPFREQIASILTVMIERGIALEVNTSGLRQPCAEPFPSLEILKLYRELGGELITVGSDAHRIEQLGFGLRQGLSLIRAAGFDAVALYHERKPRLIGADTLTPAPVERTKL